MFKIKLCRNLFVTVILCVLLIANTVGAVPMQGITEIMTEVHYASDGQVFIGVTGRNGIAGEQMVFVTMNPNCLPEAIGNNDKTSIAHQDVITANADNTFEYKFSIKNEKVTQSGVYSVYAGSYSATIGKLADVNIFDEPGMQGFISQVTGADVSQLTGLFTDSAEKFSIHNFEPFKAVDKGKLAESICDVLETVDQNGTVFDTYNNVVKLIKSYSVTEAFNQNKKASILDGSGNFLYTDIIGFESIEKEEKTTFIDCFNSVVSDSTQKLTVDDMFEKSFSKPEEAYRKYAENVVIYGIRYPKMNGYGHIEQLLTENNRKYLGINIEGAFTNKRQQALAEHQTLFADIDEIESFINSIEPEGDGGNGSGGSGSSGGSGGSGSSGGSGGSGGSGSSGGSGGSGGGLGTSSRYEIEKDYEEMLEQKTETNKIFDDVAETHWAAEAIASLKEKGIINGETDRNYNPNGFITREQFVKIICTASETEISADRSYEEMKFEDVNVDEWYMPYVATAYELGIVNGVSNEKFGIGQNITRQDLCVMASRMFSITASEADLTFTDSDSVEDYAKAAVEKLVAAKIINGYGDGSFRPNEPCTRAEAAQIIYKIIKRGE